MKIESTLSKTSYTRSSQAGIVNFVIFDPTLEWPNVNAKDEIHDHDAGSPHSPHQEDYLTSESREDAESSAQILFFSALKDKTTHDSHLSALGLYKGLIDFADMFPLDQRQNLEDFRTVHSVKKRMVMLRVEKTVWLAATIQLETRSRKSKSGSSSSKADIEYVGLSDEQLHRQLLAGYHDFRLLNGTFLGLKTLGPQHVQNQSHGFWSSWVWQWDSMLGKTCPVPIQPAGSFRFQQEWSEYINSFGSVSRNSTVRLKEEMILSSSTIDADLKTKIIFIHNYKVLSKKMIGICPQEQASIARLLCARCRTDMALRSKVMKPPRSPVNSSMIPMTAFITSHISMPGWPFFSNPAKSTTFKASSVQTLPESGMSEQSAAKPLDTITQSKQSENWFSSMIPRVKMPTAFGIFSTTSQETKTINLNQSQISSFNNPPNRPHTTAIETLRSIEQRNDKTESIASGSQHTLEIEDSKASNHRLMKPVFSSHQTRIMMAVECGTDDLIECTLQYSSRDDAIIGIVCYDEMHLNADLGQVTSELLSSYIEAHEDETKTQTESNVVWIKEQSMACTAEVSPGEHFGHVTAKNDSVKVLNSLSQYDWISSKAQLSNETWACAQQNQLSKDRILFASSREALTLFDVEQAISNLDKVD